MASSWGYGLLLSLLFMPTLYPLSTQAANQPSVVLSEINWGGSEASTADEWLELVNLTSQPVPLGGWTLTGAAPSGGALTLPAEATIPAGGTYLIANYGVGDKSTLLVPPQWVTSDLSLPNEKLTLRLFDAAGVLMDELVDSAKPDFGSSSPAVSMERNLQTLAWQSAAARSGLTSAVQLGTPGASFIPLVVPPAATPAPTPAPSTAPTTMTPPTVVITELVADPVPPGNEWVELHNPDPSTAVDLTGWILTDASGATTTLGGTLAPESYAVIESPNGQLNNTGDSLALTTNGQTVASVQYGTSDVPAPADGESLALSNDTWTLTPAPTPAAANEQSYVPPETYPSTAPTGVGDVVQDNANLSLPATTTEPITPTADRTVVTSVVSPPSAALQAQRATEAQTPTVFTADDLADAPLGTAITLETTALAEPGVTSKQILLVDGAEVYFNRAQWPAIDAGDRLRITGTLQRTQDNLRLKISAAEQLVVTGSGRLPLTTTWDDAREGALVAVTGTFLSKKQTRLMVNVDGQELPIILAANAKITVPKNTTEVNARGIKRYRSGELVLLVTSADDLSLTLQETLAAEAIKTAPKTTAPTTPAPSVPVIGKKPLVGGGIVSGALALVGSWYAKARRVPLPL